MPVKIASRLCKKYLPSTFDCAAVADRQVLEFFCESTDTEEIHFKLVHGALMGMWCGSMELMTWRWEVCVDPPALLQRHRLPSVDGSPQHCRCQPGRAASPAPCRPQQRQQERKEERCFDHHDVFQFTLYSN